MTAKLSLVLALGCLLGGAAFGQHVISARSGLIHYTEGDVFLGDSRIEMKAAEYPEVKAGQHLRTADGRAEVLLSPGVFLRLSENSEIAMESNQLSDTRVTVLNGSVLVEAGEINQGTSLAVTVHGKVLEVRKRGVFRIDADTPSRVRVFDGEITVADPGRSVIVKEGRQVMLTSVPAIEKFQKQDTDSFHRWAGRRSGYLAMANMSAAGHVRDNNVPWQVGGWYFSPYFGMFTYIPMRGMYRNYWNHSYYAPSTVFNPRQPAPMMPTVDPFGGGGFGGMRDRGSFGGGGGRGVYSAPSAPSAGGGGMSAPAGGGGQSGSSAGGGSGRR